MDYSPEPADDVLLALGRVTWAALALEAIAVRVAAVVAPDAKGSAGTRIREAATRCAEWDDGYAAELSPWLTAAQEALSDKRHPVLHGVSSAWAADPDLSGYVRVLRDAEGTLTPLTPEALGDVAAALRAARADGDRMERVAQLYRERNPEQ